MGEGNIAEAGDLPLMKDAPRGNKRLKPKAKPPLWRKVLECDKKIKMHTQPGTHTQQTLIHTLAHAVRQDTDRDTHTHNLCVLLPIGNRKSDQIRFNARRASERG